MVCIEIRNSWSVIRANLSLYVCQQQLKHPHLWYYSFYLVTKNVGTARLFKMGLLVYILLFIYGSIIDVFGNYFSFNSLMYCSTITKNKKPKKTKTQQFMCIWYNLLGTVRRTGFTSCTNSLRRKNYILII